MEIKVYKCEYTGKLFEKEKDYLKHLRKQKELEEEKKSKKEIQLKSGEIKNSPRLTSTTIEEFSDKMFEAVKLLSGKHEEDFLLLEFSQLRFGNISNYHYAPIGYETNWGAKDGLPKSYPGWDGTVTMVFSKDNISEDIINNIIDFFPGLYKGSGGYRGTEYKEIKGYVLQYSLKLFLYDFPLIKEKYDRLVVLNEDHVNWFKEIQELVSAAQEDNEDLVAKKATLKGLQGLMNDLQRDMDILRASIIVKERSIKGNLFHSNPFEHIEEYETLKKELLINEII